MIYVTSDLHGRADCLEKLLKMVSFSSDDWLYIIGDVIDRNDNGGVDILKWLLVQPNVQLLLGNHEHMMLACSWVFDEVTEKTISSMDQSKLYAYRVWKQNGAGNTLAALVKESPETRADILEYLRECPVYETVSAGGRDFLLVHGGLENYSPDKKMSDYCEEELLWVRPTLNTHYSKNFTTIVGHTPTHFYGSAHKGRILDNGSWIDIDTGAAAGLTPCFLRLDDMRPFYLDADE